MSNTIESKHAIKTNRDNMIIHRYTRQRKPHNDK
jgi:hypothetical protein